MNTIKYHFVFLLLLSAVGVLSCVKSEPQAAATQIQSQEIITNPIPNKQLISVKPDSPQLLDPDFDFSQAVFATFMGKYLKEPYLANALAQPKEFLQLLAAVIEQQDSNPYLSLLVDKEHPLPMDYAPDDLVVVQDHLEYRELTPTRSKMQLRKLLLPDLLRMNTAAMAAGVTLPLGSTYRSFSYQRDVFRRYTQRDGIDAANRYSARPGESQHQLGLVIDFAPISRAIAETATGKWLFAHALEYGFSLSYPEGREAITGYIYEPWHYRYVGPQIAQLLSQYFNGFQQDFFLFWDRAALELRQHYQKPKSEPEPSQNNRT